MTTIRDIQLVDIEPLVEAAAADHHSVIRPTHLIEKNGEIAGYLSIGAIPMVAVWLHTKRATIFDSVKAEQFASQLVKQHGSSLICTPCDVTSPLHKYMPRVGYKSFGKFDIFLKSL